jgi:hypothetical protein
MPVQCKLSDHHYMKVGPIFILVFFICSIARSQTRHGESGTSARFTYGTAIVAPSVWLVKETTLSIHFDFPTISNSSM